MLLAGIFKMKTSPTESDASQTRTKIIIAATLTTWSILLSGTAAETINQRCYACGPQADEWYPNGEALACENFTESDQFSVDCGEGHFFCGITTTPKTHVISRICSENYTNECFHNVEDDTILCTCNGSLCNGISLADQIYKIHSNKQHAAVKGTLDAETPEEDDSHHNRVPIELGGNNNDRVNSGIHIIQEKTDQQPVTGQSLPSPAALGTEDKQGAPVDDEEDTAEGSGGNRVEIEVKTSTIGQTTTEPTTTITITTESTKNSALSLNKNLGIIIASVLFIMSCH